MSRKHTPRRVWPALPPRGLRPKLAKDQLTDLALAHLINLDLISHGQADEEILWHMVEAVFLWSRVADMLERGQDEMRAQLELATRHGVGDARPCRCPIGKEGAFFQRLIARLVAHIEPATGRQS